MGNKGGAREGSGRPPVQVGGAVQKSLSLRDGDVDLFKMLGNGQMSAGARRAADISRMVVEHVASFIVAVQHADFLFVDPDMDVSKMLKELHDDLETSGFEPGESGLASASPCTEQEKAIA